MAAAGYIISQEPNGDWIVSNKHGAIGRSKRPSVLIGHYPDAAIDDLSAVQAHIKGEVLAGIIKEKKS